MKFKKIISALVGTVVLASAVSASAMSLLQPYGYSMPIEKLAQNPADSTLTNESYIALTSHNVSLDGTDVVMTGNSSDGMVGKQCVYKRRRIQTRTRLNLHICTFRKCR